jgi:hypothetical protein
MQVGVDLVRIRWVWRIVLDRELPLVLSLCISLCPLFRCLAGCVVCILQSPCFCLRDASVIRTVVASIVFTCRIPLALNITSEGKAFFSCNENNAKF